METKMRTINARSGRTPLMATVEQRRLQEDAHHEGDGRGHRDAEVFVICGPPGVRLPLPGVPVAAPRRQGRRFRVDKKHVFQPVEIDDRLDH